MKIKTADLIGPALDWAVAKCEGKVHGYKHQLVDDCRDVIPYTPSVDWSQGGPIIERGNIDLISPTPSDPLWQAMQWRFAHGAKGPTPLIAAMRCFVAAHLGDEVDVPDELLRCRTPW